MVCVPPAKEDVEYVAIPELLSDTVPNAVDPSSNETVPVALVSGEATVAVKVTD
jgi:hypothetical protein